MAQTLLSRISNNALVFIIVLQAWATISLPVLAQDMGNSLSAAGTPRPKIQTEGSVPLGRGGYDPKVFVSAGKDVDQSNIYLYHEPLIFVQADREGLMKHDIDDSGMVTLYMRWDPDPKLTRDIIRAHFAEQRGAPSETWVISPLIVAEAWFESSRDSKVKSRPLPPRTSFTERGNILVHFALSTQHAANDFVADLQAGTSGLPRTQLVFRYTFEGVAEELCTAHTSYEDIQTIERFRDLTGEGREGYVERKQTATIAKDIGTLATRESRCSDVSLLQRMTNQAMEQLGTPNRLGPDQRLDDFTDLGDDLKSSISTSLREAINVVSSVQDKEAFINASDASKDMDISVGYGPFIASLSQEFSEATQEGKEKFRDELRRLGIEGEWHGTEFVAQTLDVYSTEEILSRWQQGVNVEYTFTKGETTTFSIVLTEGTLLIEGQEPHQREDALRSFEERLNERMELLDEKLRAELLRSSVPSGTAAYFSLTECPIGWEVFTPASGRVIIAATSEGMPEYGTKRRLGDQGGQETVELSSDNLPPHSHEVRLPSQPNYAGFPNRAPAWGKNFGQRDVVSARTANDGGRGMAFSVLPPFHVLLLCIKT